MNWDELIHQEMKQSYFKDLMLFLNQEDQNHLILPPKEQRLQAFKLTPYEDVKVVIIGQDPYHNINQAHGLAFSVKTQDYPPSLKNIFKELKDDLGLSVTISSGDLTPWAKQGVMLLNTTLTVPLHHPLGHQNQGWEIFTRKVIQLLNQKNKPIVFILWGNHAQQFIKEITNPIHLVLKSPHPSPLSAHRGFFGSKPFSKTNAFLLKHKYDQIDWNL